MATLQLCLTVSEVKVRQIPPNPFMDTAINMIEDNTVNEKKKQCLHYYKTLHLQMNGLWNYLTMCVHVYVYII